MKLLEIENLNKSFEEPSVAIAYDSRKVLKTSMYCMTFLLG